MIPTMLLAGVVVGLVALERRSRPHAVAVGVLLALAWGLTVSVIADEPVVETFAGGTLLGLANLVVGAALVIGLALGLRGLRRMVPRV